MKPRVIRPVAKYLSLAALAGIGLAVLLALPYRIYAVHTGSMAPTFPLRSAVVVREGVYRIGQPISFRIHGETVTHRLVRDNLDGTLTTKGDANKTVDTWRLPRANVIGGVVLAPRDVGFLLVFLRNPEGFIAVLLGIFCIMQIMAAPTSKVENLTPSVP